MVMHFQIVGEISIYYPPASLKHQFTEERDQPHVTSAEMETLRDQILKRRLQNGAVMVLR